MKTPESSPRKGFPKVTLTKTEDAPLRFAKSHQGKSLCSRLNDAGRQGLDLHAVLFDKGSSFAWSFALKDACSLQL